MRRGRAIVGGLVLSAALQAQHAEPATPAATAAEQKRGASTPATHVAHPTLPPLLAWQHVKDANAAVAKARTAGTPAPPLPARPAGAGRYVCAVLVCADADVDVPALLGLRRADVLLVSTPGPFANPESLALIERVAAAEHVPLLLVLGHADCRTIAARAADTPPDTLSRRTDAARAEAERRQQPLPKTLVQLQREHLLAASDLLRERVLRDELRILPGTIDGKSHAISWHHARVDAMPLAPVK